MEYAINLLSKEIQKCENIKSEALNQEFSISIEDAGDELE